MSRIKGFLMSDILTVTLRLGRVTFQLHVRWLGAVLAAAAITIVKVWA